MPTAKGGEIQAAHEPQTGLESVTGPMLAQCLLSFYWGTATLKAEVKETEQKISPEETEKQMAFDLYRHLIQERKHRGNGWRTVLLPHTAFIFKEVLEVLTSNLLWSFRLPLSGLLLRENMQQCFLDSALKPDDLALKSGIRMILKSFGGTFPP